MKHTDKLAALLLPSALSLLLVTGCSQMRQTQETEKPALAADSRATLNDPPKASVTISDQEIRDVVARVAKHQIHPLADGEYPAVTNLDQARAAKAPEGIEWIYPWGVDLYGLLRSSEVTSDKDADNFVVQHNQICGRYYEWLAGLEKQFGPDGKTFAKSTALRRLMELGNLDSCGAMGVQMLESMSRHPDQVTQPEKDIVARIANWILKKQDRLPEGTLWRAKVMGGTVWPDDLYMGCPFIVRWSKYTGDKSFLDDAANQIVQQAELQQDADGLFFHGYNIAEKKHSPFKWGRGNGWVTVATVEVLSALPEDHPARAQLIAILKKQVDGLKPLQAADGMWRQVLDHPELWEETSCTAMFAYGIARAVNRGWLDASYMPMARKAFAGISKNVTADGAVNETCEGTNIGQTLEYYQNRRRPPDDEHGRGPVLLAGTEILMSKQK